MLYLSRDIEQMGLFGEHTMRRLLVFLFIVCVCASHGCDSSDIVQRDACDPETFKPACLGENAYTACEDLVIVTKECKASETCADGVCAASLAMLCSDDEAREAGCAESELCAKIGDGVSCFSLCTREEFASKASRSECNDYDERITYRCMQFGENAYGWEETTQACPHGCNSQDSACVTIHADEGKACSAVSTEEDYYARRCDGKFHLACRNGFVVAEDCGENACHNEMGCYMPCDAKDNQKYVCSQVWNGDEVEGYDLGIYTCTEHPEFKILYYEPARNEFCDMTCNEESGHCA